MYNMDDLELKYAFWGGELDGEQFDREFVECICEGHTPNNSYKRAMGVLCPRKELDEQPTIKGYYGPMWDGIRHILNDGTVKYDFEVIDKSKIVHTYGVLRYETEEVYENMSV